MSREIGYDTFGPQLPLDDVHGRVCGHCNDEVDDDDIWTIDVHSGSLNVCEECYDLIWNKTRGLSK